MYYKLNKIEIKKYNYILIVFIFIFNGMERINAQPMRYLFLDTTFVENINNVSFHVNPPERHEAVIFPDKPWEKRMISFYLSVIEEEGKIRMWYICRILLIVQILLMQNQTME